ncbi:MAG: IS701 family transposase [Ardenticatenaceae bacterium]
MPSPSVTFMQIFSVFAIAFTSPAFAKAVVLACGTILTPGPRTVSAALRAVGLKNESKFGKYHRLLNRDNWNSLLLSQLLLQLIVEACLDPASPLTLAVDETLERRWGPQITILGYYRDPVRSTKKKVVMTTGIRWLCLSIVVPLPWCKREWALPFLTVALLSPKTSAKLGKRHHTTVQRTAQLICLVRRLLADREIVVVGDGAYAAVALIQHCQRKRIRVTLVSRLLWNARLFDEPTPQPKSKRGPKPKKGSRQPKLSERFIDSDTEWKRIEVDWYGGQKKEIEIATGKALWHRSGLNPVPIRWVLVRSIDGSFDPLPLFSSCQNATPTQIVQWFVLRWNIEVAFEELRAHLGFGTQRHWSDKAIERTIPCLFGLFSVIVLIALKLHPEKLPVSKSAWYNKTEATFSDAIAAVRNDLWSFEQLEKSPQNPNMLLIPISVFSCLRQIALHPR